MPRAIFIKGCGVMACCSYAEVALAMDRAYAVPSRQPLPMDETFAALTSDAGPALPARKSPAPIPGSGPVPEPG